LYNCFSHGFTFPQCTGISSRPVQFAFNKIIVSLIEGILTF